MSEVEKINLIAEIFAYILARREERKAQESGDVSPE